MKIIKKILCLFVFCLVVFTSTAQTLLDSIITTEYDGAWLPHGKRTYEYNAHQQIEVEWEAIWDTTASQCYCSQQKQKNYFYDSAMRLDSFRSFFNSYLDSNWYEYGRECYLYYSGSNQLYRRSPKRYSFSNAVWFSEYFYNHYYLPSGELDSIVSWVAGGWNGYRKQYFNHYHYNASNQLSSTYYTIKSSLDSIIYLTSKDSFIYNGSGQLTEMRYYVWNDTISAWYPNFVKNTTYQYNPDGSLFVQEERQSIGTPYESLLRSIYVYNTDGTLSEKNYSGWGIRSFNGQSMSLRDQYFYHTPTQVQIQQEMLISIFPNPSKGIIRISFQDAQPRTGSIRITNIDGKIVHQYQLKGESEHIAQLNDVASGLYVAEYWERNQRMAVEKVIVEN
jgi:Secretion system C-terminal sorting domain